MGYIRTSFCVICAEVPRLVKKGKGGGWSGKGKWRRGANFAEAESSSSSSAQNLLRAQFVSSQPS